MFLGNVLIGTLCDGGRSTLQQRPLIGRETEDSAVS